MQYIWPRHEDLGRNVFEAEVSTIFEVAREKMNRSLTQFKEKKKRKLEHYMEPREDRHFWLDSNGQDYEISEKLHVQRMTWKQYNAILKDLSSFCCEHGLDFTEPILWSTERISCSEEACQEHCEDGSA